MNGESVYSPEHAAKLIRYSQRFSPHKTVDRYLAFAVQLTGYLCYRRVTTADYSIERLVYTQCGHMRLNGRPYVYTYNMYTVAIFDVHSCRAVSLATAYLCCCHQALAARSARNTQFHYINEVFSSGVHLRPASCTMY